MTIQSRVTGRIWIDSTYDVWRTSTLEVNFAPKTASASVAKCSTYHWSERMVLGIKSFDYRDTLSGPNKTTDFGGPDDWQPAVYHKLMTSVTFGIGVYYGSYGGGWTLDFWR